MNIENIVFWSVLIVFVTAVCSWNFRDAGSTDVFKWIVAIACGIILGKLLWNFGIGPSIIGFVLGFIIGITNLIFIILGWLWTLIKKLLSWIWKPWWVKLILIALAIIVAFFIIASFF